MKKSVKKIVIAGVSIVAVGAIAAAGYTANLVWGNPITENKAEKTAIAYVEENYPEFECELIDTDYNFKDGKYTTSFRSLDDESIKVSVSCDHKGEYHHDDYSWNALKRFSDAVEKEVNPLLIAEFGEKSSPELYLSGLHDLLDTYPVKINQTIDLDNFPFELELNMNLFSDDTDYDSLIKDAVQKINGIFAGRFTVEKYLLTVYNSDGTDIMESFEISEDEAKAMLEK